MALLKPNAVADDGGRMNKRHLVGTAASAVPFIGLALGLALFAHTSRHVTAVDVVVLAAFAVLTRVEYQVGVGSAVAGQLAFMPLLFLMPLKLVPIAVCLSSLAATGVLRLAGRRPTLCPNALGVAWFTIPPTLILLATGEQSFSWHRWPLYLLVLIAQSGADLVPAAVFERTVNGTQLRPLAGVLGMVYGLDVVLTPIGMLAASEGGYSFLAALPFMAVLWLLVHERRSRLDAETAAGRMEQLAHVDELTGAGNRRRFDEVLAREIGRAGRSGSALSVCIVDLDHFKRYNDTYGHPAGDDLLQRLVVEWGHALRQGALLARIGGEEFGIVLPDADPAAAEIVIERLRSVTPREITFSAGVATWAADATEGALALVARADAALYRAKAEGRDRLVLTA
jgi:diguanylate cyclase (GGDEF)-like protein